MISPVSAQATDRRGGHTGVDVSGAQQVLNEASQLVTIPNAGGRYSSTVLPDPHAVPHVRQAVAQAIEDLSRASE